VLNGAAVMLLVSIITANVVVMSMLNPGIAYFAPSDSLVFPKDTVFLVTTVAALVAVACFIGAYVLYVRVRFVSTRASTRAQPGMPPG